MCQKKIKCKCVASALAITPGYSLKYGSLFGKWECEDEGCEKFIVGPIQFLMSQREMNTDGQIAHGSSAAQCGKGFFEVRTRAGQSGLGLEQSLTICVPSSSPVGH